jgi:NTE family protein
MKSHSVKVAMKKKTLGFALGAGGSRGVAHIGFLQAMEEEGLKPDYISGCSMGAIVGAAYANGLTTEYIHDIVKKLRLLDLIAPTGRRGGLFETRKIKKLLQKHMGDVEFSALKIPFSCVSVDLNSQRLIEFKEGSVIDGMIASSCIPGVFRPYHLNDMRLIDGCVLERVPAKQVKEMGADVVVCVDVLGRLSTAEECSSTISVLLEMYDLVDNARTVMRRKENEKIIDFWLEPDLGEMNQYSLRQVEFAYEKGYELGKKYAPQIKAALKK